MARSPQAVTEREKCKQKLVRLLAESPFMPDRRKYQLLTECRIDIVPGKKHYELNYDALTAEEETYASVKHWVESSFKSKKKHYMEPTDKQSYDVHLTVVDGRPARRRGLSNSKRDRIRIALQELDTLNMPESELEQLVDLILGSGGELNEENDMEFDFDVLTDKTLRKIRKILRRLRARAHAIGKNSRGC